MAQVWRAISAIAPATSTPVGPAPTITNVSPGAPLLGLDDPLRDLESVEDLVPDAGGLLDALEARRPFAPFVVAIVGALRARGHDQRVVFEARAVREAHGLRGGIDVHDVAQEDACFSWRLSTLPQRRRDLARRERAGRDLIEQRLKKMKVASVDQGHVHGAP